MNTTTKAQNIGNKIKSVRTALGLGQTEFAALIDIAPEQLDNYESGKKLMPLKISSRILCVLRPDLFMGDKWKE